MQAAGQYGEVPQYVGSRVGASHGHMFNISHEMSLSPTASGQGHSGGHSHGHGLSLSHPPHSQASQSHLPSQILPVAASQPSFLQSHQSSQSHHQQQQQQQTQHGFNMSMGGAPPKTTSAPLPSPAPAPTHAQPQSQALQSAAQQLQADIKQHQQVHNHQPHSQQQTIGDQVQQRQQQPPPPATLHASAPEVKITSPSQQAQNVGGGNKGGITREESLDGDDQDDEGEKGGGGNRWPRQEALALLKIRSEMDAAFKDSSLKGPLWEEISRKLAEMGFHRSGKKCKEKFENVHKYYKRTKDGKTGRQDGRSYRFFTQLEALYGKAGDNNTLINPSSKSLNINSSISNNNNSNIPSSAGLLSLNGDNVSAGLSLINAPTNSNLNNDDNNNNNNNLINSLSAFPAPFNTSSAAAATNAHIARTLERVESIKHESENSGAHHFFVESTDDDEDDDEEFEEPARESGAPTHNSPNSKKRKRNSMKKYLVFFDKVMKKVLDKQEHMQQKFLEALERRDQDRMMREEAWKRQEMARLNREHDVRAAERAHSASRDASLVAFLQKMTGQSIPLPHSNAALQSNNQQSTAIVPADYMQSDQYNNADKDVYDPTSKRWPKPEVLALIKLRTSLDRRFHEPGSKAVLWEEISAGMTAQGFARTSKRCKEKWENINKYFKKAKDSNKKRPENAKTCPYFHHLNALYKEGLLGGGGGGGSSMSSKHLMVTEKGEEQSEDLMDQQGNTSTYNGEESGQAQEEESEILPAGEIEGPGLNRLPTTSTGDMTSANLALRTSNTSIDAKMHMFMGSERIDKDAGIKKAIPSSDATPLVTIDLSAAANKGQPVTTGSLLFSLDKGMSSTKSLPSGPTKQPEQSHA